MLRIGTVAYQCRGRFSTMSRIVFWLLLGKVLLSPIPFGATLPWAYTLLALIVGALVLVWSTTLLFAGSPPPATLRMIALQFRGDIPTQVIQKILSGISITSPGITRVPGFAGILRRS